ncbi:MAG TPA: PAS domain S-box protein [Stellaceae bacterium]|nr:PAS domain S-box protein [Stellaceae bacterium]
MNWILQISLAFQFLNNAALLAVGTIGYCELRHRAEMRLPRWAQTLLCGAVFGTLGILTSLAPAVSAGKYSASLFLTMAIVSTLSCGIASGAVATSILIVYGGFIKGSDLALGMPLLIAIPFALAAAYRRFANSRGAEPRPVDFGIVALATVVALLGALAWLRGLPAFATYFPTVSPAWIVMFIFTTVALGAIIRHLERSRALARLVADNERRFRGFYNETPVMLTAVDHDGRIAAVSDCWLEVLGYRREEVIGRSQSEFLSPESPPLLRDHAPPVLREERPIAMQELQLLRKDGSRVEASATTVLRKDPVTGAEETLSFVVDQTARKRAERSLAERESELRAIVDHAPVAIFLKDREGRYRLVTSQFEQWTGIAAAGIIGRTDAELVPAEVAQQIRDSDLEVLKKGRIHQAEHRPSRPKVVDEQLLVTKFPIRDDAGRITGIAGFAVDITERKRTEAVLRERDRDLRAIMDNAPFAIFLKDRQGRYRLSNRFHGESLGIAAAELYGRTSADVFPPAMAREMDAQDREVVEHGRITVTEVSTGQLARKPGIEHMLVMKFPVPDEAGAIVGVAGFSADITLRKRAEDALRRSEERFRALIEHSNDMVTVIARDGRITYRSPSSVEVTGYPAAEVLGRSLLDLVHPNDVGAIKSTVLPLAGRPGARASGRTRIRHRDGSWRTLAWSARDASDVPGVEGIIINSRDVTEAQQLENQLRESQKMEAIGQLAGGIAHDFNNILGAILGFAGFLLQDLPKEAPEHRFVERIVTAGERGKDLARQILAFSRRSAVEREPIDLARLARETRDLLSASLPSSTRFELTVGDEGLVANVNAAQINQILLNLCLNANDALQGEPGAIAVALSRVEAANSDAAPTEAAAGAEARSEAGRAVVGALRPGCAYARIAVADTGVGMPPDVLKRIFDPFFTTKARGRGTGLGLSVVHGIVTDHGGALLVTSRPGGGSVFNVYLPLADHDAEMARQEAPAAELRGRERVLVVDDDVVIADVLSMGLERLGYEAVALNEPQEAVEAVAQDPDAWDVVVSDQVMPRIKGLALFRRLKEIHPSLRFILCTGFGDGVTEETALAAGVDAFFMKPASPEEIADAIRRLMRKPAPKADSEGAFPSASNRHLGRA